MSDGAALAVVIDADIAREIVAEEAPCNGCAFAERCRDERLACDQFALYSSGSPQSRWSCAPRAPTRERFLVLFDQ